MLIIFFYILYYSSMRKFKLWNVDGLTKFTKDEIVLSDLTEVAPWEVQVYKTDASGEPLRNDNGNLVKYTVKKERLREVDIETPNEDDLNILQKRVLKKMFTDKTLDVAADYEHQLRSFIKLTLETKSKLEKIANKLMWKLNDLNTSVDYMDADAFKKTMAEINAITKLIEKEPLDTIKQLHSDLQLGEDDIPYDAVQDILIDD